jgi:two-component system nitrogen regulation sensor histidine kinase NtrY
VSLDSNPELVLGLLWLNVILLLSLGLVVARRLAQLLWARHQGSTGSRLHTRLVGLFSVVAVAPAIVVAVFAVMFLHYGLAAWFSERVSRALRNSLSVAEAYLEEHKDVIRADALAMASDIDREGPSLVNMPEAFQRLFDAQAALRSLTEAIMFRGDGRVVARTGLSFSFGLEGESLPNARVLQQARQGDIVVLTNDTEDRVRALVALGNFVDTYLYVGRFVDSQVLEYLAETREVVDEYRSLEIRRSGIERMFAVTFGVVALLLLLAAVWVGLLFANSVAVRITRLTQAADRVRAGDLRARVPELEERDEIDHLLKAFNRMTDQLSSQRSELIDANSQLDQRRRFTETVISGVSAGVIGLDEQGRVTLPNRFAADFLVTEAEALIGRPIIAVMPEIAGPLAGVIASPELPIEEQIEFRRDDGSHTLLVRVAGQLDDEERLIGFVVTFDDITELLAAQRNAAWSEVARRIAHEIKNPLTPIRLSAERLKRKYLPQIKEDKETFVGSTETIVRQVDNIGRLINEFSAFARMPAPVFNRESACDLVRQAVYLQAGARPEIRFETQLPDEDIQLYCDNRKVAQALTNLLQNAVQSVRQRLEDDKGEGEPGRIEARLSETEQFCLIEVEDNGLGLPKDEPVGRLTEPYVTKRADGTGLGLAIVKKIMEEHGGTISLRNASGLGAIVALAFPVVPVVDRAAAE